MFGFFEKQYLRYKKNHVRNLLLLAKSDGHLHPSELEFITKAGEKIGLKPQQMEKLFNEEFSSSFSLPAKYEQKLNTLHDVVALTWADGVVDPAELTLCKSMASSLEFDPAVIDMLIQAFEEGIPGVEEWEIIKFKAKSFYQGQ